MPKGTKPRGGFRPGQSGNPNGRLVEKIIADQIRIILNEEGDDEETGKRYKKLRLLAGKIVSQALEGHAAQQSMILDRIDGKVPLEANVNQQTTITHKSETLSRFDAWLAEIAAGSADTNDADVGTERSVLPDPLHPESTRH